MTRSSAEGEPVAGSWGGRIDVHAHCFPPLYHTALTDAGITAAGGFPITPWTPDLAVRFMDRHGILAQVLSIANPGVGSTSGGHARDLARQINKYAAALLAARPSRFGALAVLPLPDVAGAVDEVVYALDVLGLDGVGVLTPTVVRWEIPDSTLDGRVRRSPGLRGGAPDHTGGQ